MYSIYYLRHELVSDCLVIFERNESANDGALEKEPQWQLCQLGFYQRGDRLMAKLEDLCHFLFPLLIFGSKLIVSIRKSVNN